jgi:hypothetical protein
LCCDVMVETLRWSASLCCCIVPLYAPVSLLDIVVLCYRVYRPVLPQSPSNLGLTCCKTVESYLLPVISTLRVYMRLSKTSPRLQGVHVSKTEGRRIGHLLEYRPSDLNFSPGFKYIIKAAVIVDFCTL